MYVKLDAEWQEQLELRNEIKVKPNDLKRYEEKVRKAVFAYNRAEGLGSKGKDRGLIWLFHQDIEHLA